jgi:APAF-1 helical domain
LRALWNLDDVDTRDCMERFAARSLATRAEVGNSDALILHDLQRDLIRKRREKDLPGLHLRLVEAWNAQPKLPDPYAWRWAAYHLAQAGGKEDLRRLLLNFDYLQTKLFATDPNALIGDYDYLPEDKDLQLVRSTSGFRRMFLFAKCGNWQGNCQGVCSTITNPVYNPC